MENDKYKDYIVSNDIITKTITGNGNCFYNAISYYFHLSEEYNKNYREIIYELCSSSIEDIKELFYSDKDDPDINLKERI